MLYDVTLDRGRRLTLPQKKDRENSLRRGSRGRRKEIVKIESQKNIDLRTNGKKGLKMPCLSTEGSVRILKNRDIKSKMSPKVQSQKGTGPSLHHVNSSYVRNIESCPGARFRELVERTVIMPGGNCPRDVQRTDKSLRGVEQNNPRRKKKGAQEGVTSWMLG